MYRAGTKSHDCPSHLSDKLHWCAPDARVRIIQSIIMQYYCSTFQYRNQSHNSNLSDKKNQFFLGNMHKTMGIVELPYVNEHKTVQKQAELVRNYEHSSAKSKNN